MIISYSSTDRFMVPRWRTLADSMGTQELARPNHQGRIDGHIPPAVILRLQAWRRQKTVLNAAELLEVAIAYERYSEAEGAARFLIVEGSSATASVKQNAVLLLAHLGHTTDRRATSPIALEHAPKYWRARTRMYPHDALAWVELSLAQVSRGQLEPALKTMRVARNLAPNDRFVLRSAARLILHKGEPDRAHAIIKQSDATRRDPWLMAAEISLAALAQAKPLSMKRAVDILETRQLPARQLSELAGAVGTNFLMDGNRRRGRRLFEQSLADPTANSLAQAEWVSGAFSEHLLKEGQLSRIPDAEAIARHHFTKGDFEKSFAFSNKWLKDEPFSQLGHLAAISSANFCDDYVASDRLAVAGLMHHPGSIHLRVGRTFSLACLGKLDEAEANLKTLPVIENSDTALVMAANRGLIAFRRGQHQQGVSHYREAIDGFKKRQNRKLERLARVYFAREATLANYPDAAKLIEEATPKRGDTFLPGAERVLARTREIQKDNQEKANAPLLDLAETKTLSSKSS